MHQSQVIILHFKFIYTNENNKNNLVKLLLFFFYSAFFYLYEIINTILFCINLPIYKKKDLRIRCSTENKNI